ncbi:TetR family transcriptional regulator [Betaproteobacteria bacterium GR16-43]|nr:TetR family transcriptional regulator [Betaproteobacteria bacterium GR16-43]
MATSRTPAPPLGRPRAFDAEEALTRALRLFWQKGYEGTSMADLTEAMGINKPSLYAAFGNKEDLFRKALERYGEGSACFIGEALTAPTARGVVEKFLVGAAEQLTNPENPRGCLVVQGALSCATSSDPVRQELVERRKGYEKAIAKRFQKAKAEGDLPASANAADLARYVAAVHQGMAVQATSGATRQELKRVAQVVLDGWPSK